MSELRSRARAALRDVDDAKALVNEMMPEGYSPQWMRSKVRSTQCFCGHLAIMH